MMIEGMTWGSGAEWATALLALIAVTFSWLAYRQARIGARRRLLVELQDRLTAPEVADGRRILYECRPGDRPAALRSLLRHRHDWAKVNHALGLWDTLAYYVRKDLVPKQEALELWSPTLAGAWHDVSAFVRWRRANHFDPNLWPNLVWLAAESGIAVAPDLLENDAIVP